MSYLDLFLNLKLSDNNFLLLYEVVNLYSNYTNTINLLNNKEMFLNRFFFNEIQSIVNINYEQTNILYDIFEKIKKNDSFKLDDISYILTTSNNNGSNSMIRDKVNFVGLVDSKTNKNIIKVLNLDSNDIRIIMNEILNLFNKHVTNIYEGFINSILISGMVGLLQCYNDGNTRTANFIINLKTFDLVKDTIDSPAIFNYILNNNLEYIRLAIASIINIAEYKNSECINDYVSIILDILKNEVKYQNELILSRPTYIR